MTKTEKFDPDHPEKVRLKIAEIIADEIDKLGWSTRKAAQELGLPHPRVHAIRNGNVYAITLDKLLMTTVKLGFDVDIKITKKKSR